MHQFCKFHSAFAVLALVAWSGGGARGAVRSENTPSLRQTISFDRAWRFHLGEAAGADQPAFADTSWRALDLPHDWMIEGPVGSDPAAMDGPFDQKSPAGPGGGYLNGGIGWYRKTFVMPAAVQKQRVLLLFDGAYMNSDVWLNGKLLGNHPYGYTSFSYDLTPILKYGTAKNVVAVRLNVVQPSSRWYSGAGLYRHVWLIVTQPVHIAQWGTYITTPKITPDAAQVNVQTQVQNDGAVPVLANVITTLLDPNGKRVAAQTIKQKIAPGSRSALDQNITVAHPRLWSLETPALYHAVSEVRVNGSLTDSYQTAFGIRTIEFTNANGFLLNGRRVQIQGVCDHHDLGCLGAVALRRGFERQLQILKGMGCNALRTSHNPPSPELLDLCDQMGFLVMDEAFDEWKQNKTANGYGQFFDQWSERDMVSMLDRDRNHPSIILWSIGNEIPEANRAADGPPMGKRLVGICHREDPTRPVTSACNNPDSAWKDGFAQTLDVFGMNYRSWVYPTYNGKMALLGSETASSLDSRSEYGLSLDAQGNVQIQKAPNAKMHQVSSYDLWHPGWANGSVDEEVALKNTPSVAGEFVWTGFDYIGEPTPHGWPSRSSFFGINDLCGFPKDRYYFYQSQWSSRPMVHLLPHWNWPGYEGKPIPVWAYTNADTVELFLNGVSLGEKKVPGDTELQEAIQPRVAAGMPVPPPVKISSLHLAWSVPYAPGTLKAVAKKNGEIVATDEVHTAGAPTRIMLTPDRVRLAPNGQDLSYIKVSVLDKNGYICPNAANEIHFTVSGTAADLAGLDNGDPTSHESFQGTQHKVFHGLALAVLKSHYDKVGPVMLIASMEGLPAVTATVTVTAAAAPAGLASAGTFH